MIILLLDTESKQCHSIKSTSGQANLQYYCNIIDIKHYFFEIANKINCDWTKLAAALDPSIDVSIIETEKSSIFDRARLFLEKWYSKNAPNVSVAQLQVALQRIGRNDIISLEDL
ncbi:Ankyrin-3 [Trichoplax sp. H2]|nr:Ankyrin-3 [Trichoplax sp. H2]|eukprot:RDD38138.1 Ankyrin-3 [Trichoplax sp. H2]